MIATAQRADFADWLSPMLVKELRQGMRSRVFSSAFYLTQVLMILSVGFHVAAAGNESGFSGQLTGFLDGLFWFLIAVPLLFVMPARGFGALHGEIKANTLELVFLTRLSAWRITAGKYIAILVQTLLLICAILPYVVLRYFLGGVDLLEDIQKVFFLFAASAVLTAVTVAMSPYESKLLRVLFVVVLIFAVQVFASFLLAWLAVGRIVGSTSGGIWSSLVITGILVPAFVYLALEIAASKIAPPAENHALRKRAICLIVIFISIALAFLGSGWEWTFWLALAFCAPVVVDSLAEPIHPVRMVYQQFFQWGKLGRLAGVFLTPGWPSGAWFSLLAGTLAAVGSLLLGNLPDLPFALGLVSYFGALVFPAAIVRAIAPKNPHFLGFYFGLQFLFAALTVMVGIMSAIANQPFSSWLACSPSCVFLLNATEQIKTEQMGLVFFVVSLATATTFGLLLIVTLKPLRDIRQTLARYSNDNG